MLCVMTVAISLGAMTGACVQIDGGAVELSWSIRNFDGESASCDLRISGGENFADIADVRICWEPVPEEGELDQVCDPVSSTRFRCREGHGVTDFGIEEGPTAIWIEPVCEGTGVVPPPDKYQVPAPIVRNITSGGVATLNALLIVAAPDACEPANFVVD
jgi:hypothetical protein